MALSALLALPVAQRRSLAPVALLLAGILAGAVLHVSRLEVYDEQRLGGVLILALVAGRAAWRALRGRGEPIAVLPRTAWAMLGAAGTLGVLSALLAPLPRYGLLEVAHTVLLVVAFAEVAASVRAAPEGAIQIVVVGLMGVVALVVFQGAVAYGMHMAGLGTPLFPQAGFSFSNVRHFNQFQVWTLPLLALPVLWASRRAGQAAGLALLSFWWMLLIASGGRGAVLGVGAGLGLAALLHGRAALRCLRVQGMAAVAGGVLFWLFFQRLVQGSGTLLDRLNTSSDRLDLWGEALSRFQAHPLLGQGPMHYAYGPTKWQYGHPHNEPVRLLAEWGAPVAVLGLGLAVWGAWAWARSARTATATLGAEARDVAPAIARDVAPALTAALGGAALLALLDGVLVTPVSQLLFVLLGGVACGLVRVWQDPGTPATSPSGAPPRPRVVWALVALAALVGTFVCAFPDARRLPARQQAYFRAFTGHNDTILAPRYWQAGFIGPPRPASPAATR